MKIIKASKSTTRFKSILPFKSTATFTPALVCAAIAMTPLAAIADDEPAAPASTFTGHVDWVSKYILRGASETYGNVRPGIGNKLADAPESDTPAVQWGVDYVDASGWYVGYWASQINYSYAQLGKSYSDRSITDFQKDNSIENDLYGGYNFKAGDFTYTAGLTGYYYIHGEHANAFETKLSVAYDKFALNAQTLLNDTVWGNKGDTYWTFVYTQPLPFDITLTANLGYYIYKKEGKYLGTKDTEAGVDCAAGDAFIVNGCYTGNAPTSGAFRHLIVGISQPIGKTGIVWGVQGLLPGKNRFDVKQTGGGVVSISYTF